MTPEKAKQTTYTKQKTKNSSFGGEGQRWLGGA
jgi:hypothetical protein